MKRAVMATACLALSLPMLVAGCSGSSEGEDGMPGRDELMGFVRQEAESTGLPAETVDCLVNALDQLSDEELFSILEDSASADLEQKVTELSAACA